MRRFAVRHLSAVVVALAIVFLTQAVQACPNCRDSLAENDPASQGIVQGFFWSIIIMLTTPALIFVGLCSYFYLLVRRARLQNTQQNDVNGLPQTAWASAAAPTT